MSGPPWTNTPMSGSERCARGFTLLEVLAALIVLGLILSGLSAGVRFGRDAQRIEAREVAAGNRLEPVDSMLRQIISRAWPGGAGGGDSKFAGSARTLSFRTTMPESLTGSRFRDADVAVGVDIDHRLFLSWLPAYRNWIVTRPRPERISLLSGVDRVEFSYWDPAAHLPPGRWVTAWEGASAPKLVRIHFVFMKDTDPHWPDIIVETARDAWAL